MYRDLRGLENFVMDNQVYVRMGEVKRVSEANQTKSGGKKLRFQGKDR